MTEFTPVASTLGGVLIGVAAVLLGWGLAGYCPGPPITSLGSGSPHVYLFFATLLVVGYLPGLFEDRATTVN